MATSPALVADKFLMSFLSRAQRRQYRELRVFGVIGCNGGRYLVGDSVYGMPRKGLFHSYCFQPSDWHLPRGDKLLTRKLWIEANERGFRRIAKGTVLDSGFYVAQYSKMERLTDEVKAEAEDATKRKSKRTKGKK